MAENVVQTPNKMQSTNAFKRRDWETLAVTGLFIISLLATIWMVIISILGDAFRIVPAAGLLALVEVWLIFYVPVYSKLSFWGAFIFIATYLFFAVPFAGMGILPPEFNLINIVFIVLSLMACLLLFRQRDLFLKKPTKKTASPTKPK